MVNQPSTTIRVGHLGVEPRPSCSQIRRASICTSARSVVLFVQSGRLDLNHGHRPAWIPVGRSRSPTWSDDQASPRSDRIQVVSSPYGNRTHLAALKGRYPAPIDERAMLCALAERKVGREVLEPSSAVLQTAAIPSQLPAQVVVRARKNPVSLALVTPGSK